ncbi:GRB10-interacting GYF protein 2-like [Salvelinus namaycush]|uniref:GRB10-interacting GYF protein 2-like n=1 Tax=Salvelinus namaycush TaxID=8040 RepID=A0A8U1H7V8_SALNM|nr:GRB10-interacting GYF protein 2-like [Salvelinus namaycush]
MICGFQLQEEVVRLKVEVERLQTEGQRDKEEIQTLHQHWASKEAELSRVVKDAGSLLKVELNACKQQLELERSRYCYLHNRLKVKDDPHILGRGTVETFDKGTETDIPPQTRDEQVSLEELGQLNSELQRLELEAAEREQHLREKEHALRSLERLRDAERTEAQIKVSTLELKLINLKEQAGGEGLCHGGQEKAQHTDSLRSQLEESRRRANQLQQERDQAVQRLQTLRQLHQATEQTAAAGSKKEKTVCVDNIVDQDKQRRLVTEQLKSLFKERGQLGQVYGRSAGGGLQDWAPKSKVIKNSLDTLHSQRKREKELMREQQQSAGLGSVSEEQEEEDDPEREVEEEVTRLREKLHSKTHAPS